MIRYIKPCIAAACVMILAGACKKKEYSMGALTPPADVTITTVLAGQDASHPNGDGSGNVTITINATNALAYKIDYDASDGLAYDNLPTGTTTKKYTKVGLNTYKITVMAFGAGASSTTVTKDVTVQSNFTPDATLVTNLVGSGTTGKVWKVDKTVAGHFGVGPWSASSITPEWWSASPNEKVASDPCFYSSTFTFMKNTDGSFTLKAATPDGAFTKTGALAGGLPGIPATGNEGCYTYAGGTSSFSFVPSSSGIAASASTKTAIQLSGSNTFIGYGALGKEYEIMSISSNKMYLRAQGTETGNAWYLKLTSE